VVHVRVLQTTLIWSFHVLILQRMAKKCSKIYNNCIAELRLRLHEHGLKSTRLYPSKTISKSIRFPSLYTKTICPPFWLLRRGRDMFCYQRFRDDYTLKHRKFVSEVAKRKDVSNFVWTDEEVKLLLRITNE